MSLDVFVLSFFCLTFSSTTPHEHTHTRTHTHTPHKAYNSKYICKKRKLFPCWLSPSLSTKITFGYTQSTYLSFNWSSLADGNGCTTKCNDDVADEVDDIIRSFYLLISILYFSVLSCLLSLCFLSQCICYTTLKHWTELKGKENKKSQKICTKISDFSFMSK